MTSSDPEGQGNSKHQRKLFQGLFAHLPADPNRRLDALAEINHTFRQALAEQLRPVVRTLLQESPPANGDGKIELAKRLTHVLRDTNLAIVDPDSGGQAASVIADSYRLRLQSRHPTTGRQTPSRNIRNLPPLELMEHVREEPIRTWRERADRDSTPGNPKR